MGSDRPRLRDLLPGRTRASDGLTGTGDDNASRDTSLQDRKHDAARGQLRGDPRKLRKATGLRQPRTPVIAAPSCSIVMG